MSEQPPDDQGADPSDRSDRSDPSDPADPADPSGPVAVSDSRIAAAVDRLDTLEERPPADHVEVYEEVHAVLQDALAEAQGDQRHQPPGGAAR